MVPPSATLAVAVRLTVVVSGVSVMAVTAGAGFTTSDSSPPPVAPVIVACTLPASTYTSSAGAATLTVPVLVPAAMVIVAPLLSVTDTGDAAGLVRLAV